MKKLVSLFLTAIVLLLNGVQVLAGGIDKEEILSDGTKLIYVSKEKIPEKLEEYRQECLKLVNKRYSTAQNLTIRGVALGVSSLSFYVSSSLSDAYPAAALCGQVLSIIAGAIGFFYPDYRDWKLGEEFGSGYSLDGKDYYNWGDRNNTYAIGSIFNTLCNMYCGEGTLKNPTGYVEDGVVIVIRPRSKWKDEKKENTSTFRSGIYSQKDMEPNSKNNTPGYRWALINNCIPKGL